MPKDLSCMCFCYVMHCLILESYNLEYPYIIHTLY